jgi:hypothetical protein
MHSMRGKDAVGVEHAVDAIELHDPHQIELNLGLPSLRDRGTGASHARARVPGDTAPPPRRAGARCPTDGR